MDKTNKIIHKRSSVILENGKAKLPTTDQLEYGELAINFAKGAETISFKNNNDEIVSITTSAALEGIIESNMQNVQASIDAINQTIEENEEIVATALTNLDERIKSTVEVIDGIQKENDTLEDRIDTKLADKVDKTTFETLAGRVETNENTIAELQNLEQAYKDADTAIRGEFAAADTALEGRVDGKLAGKVDKATVEAISNRLTDLEEGVIENEEIVATALTDLDTRVTKVYEDFAAADTALEGRVDGKLAGKVDRDTVDAIDDRLTELEEERMKVQTVTSSVATISTLEENTYYICTSAVNQLTMTNFQNNTDKPVAHYKVFFKISSTSSTIVFPSGITWAHGEVPVINDTSFSYELDIEKITYNNTTSYRGILVKFK